MLEFRALPILVSSQGGSARKPVMEEAVPVEAHILLASSRLNSHFSGRPAGSFRNEGLS